MPTTIKTIRTISTVQVMEAAKGATTISEVARRLGLPGTKLSGHTAKMIRAAAPGLDGILQAARKPSTESTTGKVGKVTPDTEPSTDNPYRPGSTYEAIFREGSMRLLGRQELIGRVAAITGKPARSIAFSLAVLCHRRHSSNVGRSMAIREGGKIQLVALRRRNPIH